MTQKKVWIEPVLTEFGDVDMLTMTLNKNFGTGDSFTFEGVTTRMSG